jgi:hypothetical protein
MKRQISLIITMMVLACSWGFVVAQTNTKTTSLTSYMISSTKPITLGQWLKDKAITPSATTYTSPKKMLEGGNIFAEQYLVAMWRELDGMYTALGIYRKWLITTQAKVAPWGSTSDCNGLTDLDVVALMSKSPQFVDRMSTYPTIQIESFDTTMLDNACRKWVSCVGESARTAYSVLTAAQAKRPICSDRIASQFLAFYDTNLLTENFDTINQYNNIFADWSGTNAPFDLGDDIRTLMEHHFEYLVKMKDSTDKASVVASVKTAPVTRLPDELIASTQQLLTALQVENMIDPRKDTQIASLIGQFTTVSWSSATIPTGSILNACIDPAITKQNVDSILQQLQQTQQATQQYNQSLNTDQSLNNAINGSLDSTTNQPVRLSALTTPDRTITDTVRPPSLAANPLWNDIANINDADLGLAWWWGSGPSWSVDTVLSTTPAVDPMKQCAASCVQKHVSCKQSCTNDGILWWIFDTCKQDCFNTKISCSAACFCQYQWSTTPTSGEVSKIHEMFELRRCLVPTNKLRNSIDKSCLRTDPETGVMKLWSIECYLNQTIEQWTYNRESGQWGLRIKPKERFQLPNKFDLTKMIRFTIWITNKPISSDPAKHKDIDESQAKQNYIRESQLPPALINSQLAGKTQQELWQFIENQIQLWADIAKQAQAIQTVVSQK